MGHPRPLFVDFRAIQTTHLQQIMWKIIYPESSAGIRTQNLLITNLLP